MFDVSDPGAPVKTADFDTPGNAVGTSLRDNLAFVADGVAGLQVVDLTDPSDPRVVGSYATPRPARFVSAGDSFVYVVVGDAEREGDDRDVLILRQSP